MESKELFAKEIYNHMSKNGELWNDDDGFIAMGTSDDYIAFGETFEQDDINQREANAEAIVLAMNNTWIRGINPEAVPDLLKGLEMVLNDLDIPIRIRYKLKEIYLKSKLK